MKKKEFSEIQQKSVGELTHELQKLEARLHTLKTDIVTGKVKSLKEFHTSKKSVAQIHTLLRVKDPEIK